MQDIDIAKLRVHVNMAIRKLIKKLHVFEQLYLVSQCERQVVFAENNIVCVMYF